MSKQKISFEAINGWRPKLVMFDLDGTLIDTMGHFADLASELIARDYGMPRDQARRRYLETSGIPLRQQLEVIFPEHQQNDATGNEYESRKGVFCTEATMDESTVAALQSLRDRGYSLVVSSNSAQHFVDDFAQRAPVNFDLALGFGSGLAKGESHVEQVERHLEVRAADTLFVGDSIKDGELAHGCGQRFAGVVGTFERQTFLENYGAMTVVDCIADLAEILEA
jgi:phosphoglycolate phosphatase-like HAD superfamily hydrolase